MVRVTKSYRYSLQYEPSSAEVKSELGSEILEQVVWRTNFLKDHRIEIETHEAPADPREKGVAARRLEALRRRFLAESVPPERLELHSHNENCCCHGDLSSLWSARRADIYLFPHVLSQGEGPEFLDRAEVQTLESARRAASLVVTGTADHHMPKRAEDREGMAWARGFVDGARNLFTNAEWCRLTGFDSFEAWAEAGAPHPFYDSAMALVYSPQWRRSCRALIRTTRLWLIPTNLELLHAELKGRDEFFNLLGVPVPKSWPPEPYDRSVVEHTISKLTGDPQQRGWWSYYVVLDTEISGRPVYPVLLGTAGYKGLPGPEGSVEVNYGVLPEHRRRGIATESTLGLVAHAFTHENVERVIAETLVGNVPSNGVLRKCGFKPKGEGSAAGVILYEFTREDLEKKQQR